jgi:hypothetical protein
MDVRKRLDRVFLQDQRQPSYPVLAPGNQWRFNYHRAELLTRAGRLEDWRMAQGVYDPNQLVPMRVWVQVPFVIVEEEW